MCACLLTAALFACRHLVSVTIVTTQRFLTLAFLAVALSFAANTFKSSALRDSSLHLRASRFCRCSYCLPALRVNYLHNKQSESLFCCSFLMKSVGFLLVVVSSHVLKSVVCLCVNPPFSEVFTKLPRI